MKKYIIYNTEGRILSNGQCDISLLTLETNTFLLETPEVFKNLAYCYIPDILNPTVVDKLPNTIILDKSEVLADGVDFITLSNLPEASTVSISSPENGVYVTELLASPEDYLTFDAAGEYSLVIDAFPYLPIQFTITATLP